MYYSILHLLLLCWPFAIYSDYLFSPNERENEKKKKKKEEEEEEMSIGKYI